MTELHGRASRAQADARAQLPWSPPEVKRLRDLWAIHDGQMGKIAKVMGRTRGSIDGKSRVLGLQFPHGEATILAADHPAMKAGRTVFPGRVVQPGDGLLKVLKSGDNQRKLGKVVTKGAWKGYPIFSLTLEERATCSTRCKQYASCMGNNMGHAKRYAHGEALERALAADLLTLNDRHPRGFVVRLHILGDFMSVGYVRLWEGWLDLFPALRIFGYTAWQPSSAIGREIARVRERWGRFAVRTSGATGGPRTMVVDRAEDAPPGAIVCPAQTGKTTNCGTCGLCWSRAAKDRAIAFLQH